MKPQAPTRFAWQPLTPAGVARFAQATSGRLAFVHALMALAIASAFLWLVLTAWNPVITQAIDRLPPSASLRQGVLEWNAENPVVLAENPFLALSVDLRHGGQLRMPAHLQIEFGRTDARVYWLAGYSYFTYPADRELPLGRPKLQPWWGAWSPPIFFGVFLVVFGSLLVFWYVLATLYCLPLWVAGFFMNRQLTLAGSWRLAGAALMPGAVLLLLAFIGYGLGFIDLLRLLGLALLQVLLGWTYCALALAQLPLHPEAPAGGNPFVTPPEPPPEPAGGTADLPRTTEPVLEFQPPPDKPERHR